MTARARHAAYATAGLVALVLLAKAPTLFWIVIFIGLVVWVVVLMDQRDTVAAKWGDELFAHAGAKHKNKLLNAVNVQLLDDNQRLTEANAAVVARIAEVLDEHASCPAPVSMPDRARIVRIPLQRQGGRS